MLFASGAAQALAGQLDTMRVVDQAVQDGVGVGGIANDFMPGGQRELGGDDRRSAGVSLFEDFEQIMTGAGVEGFAATGRLRRDLSISKVADIVWSLNSPEFYLLLIEERGWTAEDFEHWLADAWVRLLLEA